MRKIIKVNRPSGIPLVGCIAFGIIDRGTNLLQIRPTTVCNLNCPFCSTSSGNLSKIHNVDFEVDPYYLIEELEKIISLKGCSIEANIDSVGEPTMYPHLLELIKGIKGMEGIRKISMQTNGTLLNKNKIACLKNAGLSRINLSIHSLDKNQSKFLSGSSQYDISKITEITKDIVSSGMELCITPVYLPKVNDDEIKKLILFSKNISASIGIQKYEVYTYGRKLKQAKKQTWWKFYNQLKSWAREYNVKLVMSAKDFNIERCKRIPEIFKKNDRVYATVKSNGWLPNQVIAAANNVCISVNNCSSEINSKIRIKILEANNNIYIADFIT